MSLFARFKNRLLGGGSGGSGLVGAWRVKEISVPHPFGQYVMDLRADGSWVWFAVLPTNDAGELRVEGSGTWRVSGDELHYTSGDGQGTVRYRREGEALVLDRLPATTVGPGIRCVLVRA